MMIHMTYRSGDYKVKGYLSLPYGYKLDLNELQAQVRQLYGGADMPMTAISSNIIQEQKDVCERKWPVLIYCRGGIGRVG
ncbi:hypothetical protein ACM1RC_00340 [Paenibacillus azoreducens]